MQTDSKAATAVAVAFAVGLTAGWLLNTQKSRDTASSLKSKVDSAFSSLKSKVKGASA